MKPQAIRFPIRYKLILTLTLIPVITLALYLLLAVDLFKKDKIAYVFDSSITNTRAIAAQVRAEVESLISNMQPVLEGYDFSSNEFDRISKSIFQKNPRFRLILVYDANDGNSLKKVGFLTKQGASDLLLNQYQNQISEVLRESNKEKLAIVPVGGQSTELFAALFYRSPKDQKRWIIVTLTQAQTLIEVFRQSEMYKTFLLGANGKMLFAPSAETASQQQPLINEATAARSSSSPEEAKEFTSRNGVSWLATFVATGVGDLTVASLVEKRAALAAVESLWLKSILFFVALLAATVIVSVVASQKITEALRQLYLATRKIADGDFNIQVQSRSSDEVGSLAVGFNSMAKEVARLMKETAEKARMENELKTAQIVQENLLPPLCSTLGAIEIAGFFEPASEIGGDWWHYCEIGDKIFFWIGDATGHGAPAALITSAAKSASAIIECFPQITPSKALYLMNRAIYETSKSKFMMTFFLGALDKNTGTLTYSNASHDPPFYLKSSNQNLSKSDIVLLNAVNNPRLGEQKNIQFKETTIQLEPGDTIILYTDGVIDVSNKEGKPWGERRFVKSLLKALAEKSDSKSIVEQIRRDAFEFRQDTPLKDDFTFYICSFNKSA